MQNELKEWIEKNTNLKYITCKTFGHEPSESLYFYHMQKTGGISFFGMLHKNIKIINDRFLPQLVQNKYRNPFTINRVDYKEDVKGEIKAAFDSDTKMVFTTHEPYPFHKTSANSEKFLLTTIVREPYARVASHYMYTCKHAHQEPCEEGFIEFYNDDANINYQSKFLSQEGDAKDAIKNLKEEFHSYAPLERIQDLQELYLSMYGVCDVAIGKINQNQSKKPAFLVAHKEKIQQLNQEDAALYLHVKQNPKIPEIQKFQPNDFLFLHAKKKGQTVYHLIHKTSKEWVQKEVQNFINS